MKCEGREDGPDSPWVTLLCPREHCPALSLVGWNPTSPPMFPLARPIAGMWTPRFRGRLPLGPWLVSSRARTPSPAVWFSCPRIELSVGRGLRQGLSRPLVDLTLLVSFQSLGGMVAPGF